MKSPEKRDHFNIFYVFFYEVECTYWTIEPQLQNDGGPLPFITAVLFTETNNIK